MPPKRLIATIAPTEPGRVAYFQEVHGDFREAERAAGRIVNHFYSVGGYTIRLCFAGEALVPQIAPALARALLRQPKLLILDEPTNHLDAAAMHRLMDNLMGLDNAPAVLLISHDMAVTRQAQHIYALAAGRIEPHDQYPPLAERAESKPMPVATGESI